jgi:peroxiredoxin
MSDIHDPYTLPPDLPVPVDDGAADHLEGMTIPALSLPSTAGAMLDVAVAARAALVLYCYPRTGRPGENPPAGWDEIPGARGCTPQACAFRDHHDELRQLGARVLGLSAQPVEEQREFAQRVGLPYPLVSDPELALANALDLPTFTFGPLRLYRRLTLIAQGGRVAKVFYPVFPPDRNAADIAAWLADQRL